MANETILRNGLISKASSEVEGTLSAEALAVINTSGAVQFTLPTADGDADYAMVTNGSGTLSWAAIPSITGLLSDITAESIHDLSDVEAAAGVQSGDVLQWSGSSWNHVAATSIGTTTLEGLTDTTADVTSGAASGDFLKFDGTDWDYHTLGTGDITQAMVTQHQAALTILEGQITFTSSFLTSADLTGYATETYVTNAITNVIDAAPAALDTLNELAASLNDDDDFAGTMTTALAGKADNGHNLSTHGDVTISAIAANEVLQWSGTEWQNQTLTELGISIDDLSNVALGGDTTEDKVLAFNSSGVLVPTSIADLSTSDSVSSLTDTTISALAAGELLVSAGANSWINQTPAEAGLATSSDIANMVETTDSVTALNDVAGIGSDGNLIVNSGGSINAVATISHTYIVDFDAEVNALIGAATLAELDSGSITDLDEVASVGADGEILVSDGTDLVATPFTDWKEYSQTVNTDGAFDIITAENLVGSYGAITLHYSLADGSGNMRMGTLMVITDGSSVELTDISTNQIGNDASEPVFSATTSGSNLAIKVTDGNGYTVKSTYRLING